LVYIKSAFGEAVKKQRDSLFFYVHKIPSNNF
jgi:hypothetical protein